MTSPSTNPTRRAMLKSGAGFGYLALAGLTSQWGSRAIARPATPVASAAEAHPLAVKQPHFTPRAKRVIFMFMQGGPTHVDSFDYKPALAKHHGQTRSFSYNQNKFSGKLMKSPFKFHKSGHSGIEISDRFPYLAQHADDLCLINGMHTSNPAHPQATIFLHTGSINFVRPSIGSWSVYGLGTENEDLPGFITINPLQRLGGAQNYGAAFLPAAFQGTRVTSGGSAIANIRNAAGKTAREQRRHLDLIQAMNQDALNRAKVDTEIEGVIESYELAFRMQKAVPEVMDISGEPTHIREMYGLNNGPTRNFGTQCLMARRLAESGVRFIEVTQGGWDTHNGLKTRFPQLCQSIDQPIAALIGDLKSRGMLDDTLLVWGGEFGRTPAEQSNFNGRRHNNRGYTMWMAGGGIKGGVRYGATDETGWVASENKVHTHDLHATILHALGLDHERLTYRYAGRDFRLTDVYGDVKYDMFA